MIGFSSDTARTCSNAGLVLQVGGWTQVYGNILAFATVRGAAHEVPFSQPARALVLFKAFLGGRPLPEEF